MVVFATSLNTPRDLFEYGTPIQTNKKELSSIVHNDGTTQVTETYAFNTHEELEELNEYLKSLDNQEYKKNSLLKK